MDLMSHEIEVPYSWQVSGNGTLAYDVELPFQLGHDPTGRLLVIREPDGSYTRQWLAPSVRKQLRLLFRERGVEAAKADVRGMADDLEVSARESKLAVRETFLAQLLDGSLYEDVTQRGAGRDSPLEPAPVAELARIELPEQPMLVPEWLVEGELHWLYSVPEGGKTWIALWLALRVLDADGSVLWLDEEVGEMRFADRLKTLEADLTAVSERFAYFPFPSLDLEGPDPELWRGMLAHSNPDLVVVDTATDALTEAGLDENEGNDVTRWVKEFAEPARRAGAAVLVLDHVPKAQSGPDYAIGSRAKRAKAKVQFRIDVDATFRDKERPGEITITCTKNTHAADIPEVRRYRIGGTPFQFESLAAIQAALRESAVAEKQEELRAAVIAVLKRAAPSPLYASQVRDLVRGKNTEIHKALDAVAKEQVYPVTAEPKGSRVVYKYEAREDAG